MPDDTGMVPDMHQGNTDKPSTRSYRERAEERQGAADAGPQQPYEPAPVELETDPGNVGPPQAAVGKILVVGIGASAGGLEAIGELLRYVPTGGVAYIVVQHLCPDHERRPTELLARSSRMEVVAATDGVTLESDHVYVIPLSTHIEVPRGRSRIINAVGGGATAAFPSRQPVSDSESLISPLPASGEKPLALVSIEPAPHLATQETP